MPTPRGFLRKIRLRDPSLRVIATNAIAVRETKVRSTLLPVLIVLSFVGAALTICGCAAVQAREEQERQQQERFNTRIDMSSIFVTPGATDKKYTKLGDLEYTEPFSPDAIDEAKMKAKLKQMAYAKWPDDIDAVIDEKQEVSGDIVKVTAEAIKFDSSADRIARHAMNQSLVVSPSGQ